jgi:serine/threonine-protein kinase
LRHAALLGLIVAGLAHLGPLQLAQRLDGALLGAFADWLPLDEAEEIVVVSLQQPDALELLESAAAVTIVGPSALAFGPITSSAWTAAMAWLAAVGALIGALALRNSVRLGAVLLAVAAPLVLILGSGSALAAAGTWIPVAGPGLLLLVTGAAALLVPSRLARAGKGKSGGDSDAAGDLLRRGELIKAWHAYRELPPIAPILPQLYELGTALADDGYPELAADTLLRVAVVDPDYRDVASRLVRAARPDAYTTEEQLRARAEMPPHLGRYRLLEPIGEGTMGQVFLAKDPNINRLVAIKLIDLRHESGPAGVADAIERFHREAETTGRLSHPNIVTIHDMGESDGRAFIAMEYLKGDLLSRYTSPETLLPPRLVLELIAVVADALDYAHNQNVIHRDIKPGNIMYDSVSGDIKITDFGIARLIDVNRTRTGVVLGTPLFMAPEQIEGENVKAYTDLFALGVTLYEVLTGQLPFRGNSMTKLMFVITNEPHAPVTSVRRDLPAELDRIIDTALRKDPRERYQRGADMADALRAVAGMMA